MKLSTIQVPLTKFKVDIVVGGSKAEYAKFQQVRYGFTEAETDDVTENECNTILSSTESELKGETRFLLKLSKMPKSDLPIFIHELWHLMWHISKTITDFKLNNETQTWAANMFEALFVEAMNCKYEKV